MKIGFGLPVSGAWATPANIASFAQRAEGAGYASLWTFQRLLVPEGSGMEPVYHSVLDPMVAMAFAAAVTTRIRLGVAVINAPFIAPIYLAKQAASLDVVSSGRHDLGIGLGWMPQEFTATGAVMERRGARTEEYIRVLRAIWGTQPTRFSGEFYSVPPGTIAPAPVQAGGPPILLGATAPRALRRVGTFADGWVTSSRADLSKIGDSVAIVRAAAADADRDPDSLRIICRGVVRYGQPAVGHEGRLPLSGSEHEIRADLESLAEAGVTELFFDMNWDPRIGAPDADPGAAAERAAELLERLKPAS